MAVVNRGLSQSPVLCVDCSEVGLRAFSAENGVIVQQNLEFSCCISDLV